MYFIYKRIDFRFQVQFYRTLELLENFNIHQRSDTSVNQRTFKVPK